MTLKEVKKALDREAEDPKEDNMEEAMVTLKLPNQMKSLLSMQKLRTHNSKGKLMSDREQAEDLAKRTIEQLRQKGIEVK